MICPKCKVGEIEAAGACTCCGYSTVIRSSETPLLPFPSADNVFTFPAEKTKKPLATPPLRIVKEKPVPSWRLEISQKVQEVLRAREGKPQRSEALSAEAKETNLAGAAVLAEAGPAERNLTATLRSARSLNQEPPLIVPQVPRSGRSLGGARGHRKSSEDTPLFPQHFQDPAKPNDARVPIADLTAHPGVASISASPPVATTNLPRIQLGPEALELELDYPPHPADTLPSQNTVIPDKGVLLSRTLAGLIDFIVILFSSIPLFFALVYFLGYDDVDEFSLLILVGLTVFIFLSYAIFFTALSGQTIGMMITGLQVVDHRGTLPTFRSALQRTLGFLISLGLGGIGLLWGLADRRCCCLQDHLSSTRVVRLPL